MCQKRVLCLMNIDWKTLYAWMQLFNRACERILFPKNLWPYLSFQRVRCVWRRRAAMALVQALPVTVTEHPNPGLEVQQCRPLSPHSPSGPCSGPCGPRSSGTAMGSVSSLISGRTYQEKHCRAASEFTAKPRRSTPATSCFRLQDNTLRSGSSLEQLLVISSHTQPQAHVVPPPLPTKKQPRPGNSAGAVGGGSNGNFGYVSDEVVVGDWNDNLVVAAVSPCSDSEDPRDNRTLNGNIGGPPPKLIPVSGQLEKVREAGCRGGGGELMKELLFMERKKLNSFVYLKMWMYQFILNSK